MELMKQEKDMTKIITENLKKLGENVKAGYKRDMTLHEQELHHEQNCDMWWYKKSGWNEEEIVMGFLSKVDFNLVLKFVQRMEEVK